MRKPSANFSLWQQTRHAYAAADAAKYGSDERRALMRKAALLQRQAEAADELARVTQQRRRKAA